MFTNFGDSEPVVKLIISLIYIIMHGQSINKALANWCTVSCVKLLFCEMVDVTYPWSSEPVKKGITIQNEAKT